ncbi:Dehydrin protein [Abeliophyllum distichum]|uniref:Dehydrin protein n=1 Tax=Abeliophyllum distichum TaxID=126358 RepID=A0ABD1RA63_9LAMI
MTAKAEEVKHYQQNVDEPCDQVSTTIKVTEEGDVEASDRGLFDFMGKKEEEKKPEEEVIVVEFEQKVQVCEEEEKKHESILKKLHRTSSSSSLGKVEEGGEKKKKKSKGKVSEEHRAEDISVPVQKSEEKKEFLDKIKEKLPDATSRLRKWLLHLRLPSAPPQTVTPRRRRSSWIRSKRSSLGTTQE